jgi:hypothetical protein
MAPSPNACFIVSSKDDSSGQPAAPSATVEVLRAGQSLATRPLTLDKPHASGRIRQVAQLPTDALQAGD